MAIILLGLATLLAAAAAFAWQRVRHPADGHDLQARIHVEVSKLLRRGRPPAIVVALLKDGRTHIQGYAREAQDGVPPTDAILQIGSATKLFTAALAQLLHDEGRLNLDGTLADALGPEVPLDPAAARITLRELATHTSGLPRLPASFVDRLRTLPQAEQLRDPYRDLTPQEVLDWLRAPQGIQPPGRFLYSNLGMGLLGHVLEIVCGQPYEVLLRDRLTGPLGLGSTAITLTPGLQARCLPGHTAAGHPAAPWSFGALAGAGALSSDAADLLRFVQAHLAAPAAQPPTALAASLRATLGAPGERPLGWMPASPLDRLLGHGSLRWHDGMVGGYSSYVAVMPDRGLGVVVLSCAAVPVNLTGMMLMRLLRTQSWRA